MRHRKGYKKLGRPTEHRLLMLRGMATALFEHGKVETTVARAKELSRFADKIITWAKQANKDETKRLTRIRKILGTLTKKDVAWKVIHHIAPKFENRNGGYTKVLKFRRRVGDQAETAVVLLTDLTPEEVKNMGKENNIAQVENTENVEKNEA